MCACRYIVTDARKIVHRYLRTWMAIDIVSGLPLGFFDVIDEVRILTLVRLLRVARLLRKLDALSGANYMRVLQIFPQPECVKKVFHV